MKAWKKWGLLWVSLAAIFTTGLFPSYATKKDVEAAKKKVSSMEEEKKKVEAALKNLEGLKHDTAAYVKQLDGDLMRLDQELEQLSGDIAGKEEDIARTGQELEAARETEAKQYADMKLRIKYMYERGDTSYMDMLLQSDDMAQFMNRAEYIQKISDYDRKKMDEYEATRETIAAHEVKLQEEHAERLRQSISRWKPSSPRRAGSFRGWKIRFPQQKVRLRNMKRIWLLRRIKSNNWKQRLSGRKKRREKQLRQLENRIKP